MFEETHPDGRIDGLQEGVVVRNDDPKKLGRVKLRIPGLIEPESAWAFPLGTVGGGSKHSGDYCVPAVGAEVGVLFRGGDVDHPHYLSGHWGEPDSGSEASSVHASVAPADVWKVRVRETARWLIVTDDRSGAEVLYLKDKVTGDLLELARGTVTLHGTAELKLKGGPLVKINEGSTPVAKEGSGTVGHAHSVTFALTAGPYPVAGVITVVSNTDSIAAGQGSQDVKVP